MPHVLSSAFYLAVIFTVGIPMWFFTCSTTRYSLPNIDDLESKLTHPSFRLHLDISLVQLSALKSPQFEANADKLRENLPTHFDTAIDNVTYNINWRIRRPTQDEDKIFKSHPMENAFSDEYERYPLIKLEESLLQIHKSADKFRLFVYLIDEPYYAAFCDPKRAHTYTISFERFVYLCPSFAFSDAKEDPTAPVVNLINDLLHEIYSYSIDVERAKQILTPQVDLLLSLLPESTTDSGIENLSELADILHHIFDKNVKTRFKDLTEIVNIRMITQNIVDLIGGDYIDKILEKPTKKQQPDKANATITSDKTEPRVMQVSKLGELFHNSESRLNKHSSKNVNRVLMIVPDPSRAPLSFRQSTTSPYNVLEGQDSNSILLAQGDKSLVLGLRAIVRRLIGLSSVDLCKNCLIRRDVFFNRWELDSVMGALTILKLKSVYLSLKSIREQRRGIKIPKDVSLKSNEAHDIAMKAVEQLGLKRTLESYRLVSQAYELSESAYFDPSLVDHPHFPDELKYAVYLPLFFPLAAPFVKSVILVSKYMYSRIFQGRKYKIKVN